MFTYAMHDMQMGDFIIFLSLLMTTVFILCRNLCARFTQARNDLQIRVTTYMQPGQADAVMSCVALLSQYFPHYPLLGYWALDREDVDTNFDAYDL